MSGFYQGQARDRDRDIFSFRMVPAPKRPKAELSNSQRMRKLEVASRAMVEEVLYKHQYPMSFALEVRGMRLVIEVNDVENVDRFKISTAISERLEDLKKVFMLDNRFRIHHQVSVNGKIMAYTR